MKTVFIYFRETPFDDNNKFVLDFSYDEFIKNVDFQKKCKLLHCKFRLQFDFKRRN